MHSKLNIYFSRLKLVKLAYSDWKKKIDDGLKQINSIEDKQIIEQYKPFYQVWKRKQILILFFFLSV